MLDLLPQIQPFERLPALVLGLSLITAAAAALYFATRRRLGLHGMLLLVASALLVLNLPGWSASGVGISTVAYDLGPHNWTDLAVWQVAFLKVSDSSIGVLSAISMLVAAGIQLWRGREISSDTPRQTERQTWRVTPRL